MTLSRRSFLKSSTAASAAAALSIGGPFAKKANAATGLAWPDSGTMTINPDIDNLRVVVCNDSTMISTETIPPPPTIGTGTIQWYHESAVTSKVHSNMDKMAMALAQKSEAASAWATIFRKAATKQWSQVKVAIKVNCIDSKDQPRLAIVDKICKVLNAIGSLSSDPGVPFANITVYDCSRSTAEYSSAYAKTKLPAGIVVTQNMGTAVPYTLPKGTTILSAGNLKGESIDILVNIAVNKGHDQFDKGRTTLCLKNHYGTFSPQSNVTYPKPNGCGNQDYLTDINKSTAILGGTPVRQQLCIIDSLWAMEGGPTKGTIVQNDRIVMGTFAGAVDYLTARKIRQGVMKIPAGVVSSGLTMNDAALNRFLTDFGYDLNSPSIKNLDFVDALTYTPTAVHRVPGHQRAGSSIEVTVSNSALKSSHFRCAIPEGTSAVNVTIIDMNGRSVRKLPVNTLSGNSVIWDGKTGAGKTVSPGTYFIKLAGDGFEKTGKIRISR